MNNLQAIYEAELGQQAPENLQVKVLEETADIIYLVIPQKPENFDDLSEEAMESVAAGFIGRGPKCILMSGTNTRIDVRNSNLRRQ